MRPSLTMRCRSMVLPGTVMALVLMTGLMGCAHRPDAAAPAVAPPDPAAAAVVADPDPAAEADAAAADTETPVGGPDAAEASDDSDEAFWDELDDEEAEAVAALVPDPLAPWNRLMFRVNDRLYFWAFQPLARGYRAALPDSARLGVRNFFHNLLAPVRFVNCLLQGNPRRGAAELGRFALNTTVGVLGFGNPASRYPELMPPEEDLGQTMARYGIDDGFYIFWPLLGPSTLRDTVGRIGDGFLSPSFYTVSPLEASVALYSYDKVNALSLHIGDYEALKDAAIDPYAAFRDAYIQYRRKQIAE